MKLQYLDLPGVLILLSLDVADGSILKGTSSDDSFSKVLLVHRGLTTPNCPPGYVDVTGGNAHWWSCAIGCPTEEPWVDDHCNCACVAPKKESNELPTISSVLAESQGIPLSPTSRSWLNASNSSATINNTQTGVQTQLASRPLSFFAEEKSEALQGKVGSPEESSTNGLIAGIVSITALVLLVLVIAVVTFIWKTPQQKRPIVDSHLRSASKASTASVPRPVDTYLHEMSPPNPKLCWHLDAGYSPSEEAGQFASTAGSIHAISYGTPAIWSTLHASGDLCKAEITSIDL